MILDGRLLTTLVMFAIFAGASAMALGFPAKAGFVPLLIGIPGAVLCAVQLLIDLRRATRGAPEAKPAGEAPRAGREAFMLLWLLVFTAGLLGLGFLWGGPLLVFLYLLIGERERLTTALFAGVGTFIVLYGGFVWLLELTLFPGFLPPLLGLQ